MENEIINIVIALISGGVITAIIQIIANKHRVKAEVQDIEHKTLGESYQQFAEVANQVVTDAVAVYKQQLDLMCSQLMQQKEEIAVLKQTIEELKQSSVGFERENITLKNTVEKLEQDVAERDKTIESLKERIRILEEKDSNRIDGC